MIASKNLICFFPVLEGRGSVVVKSLSLGCVMFVSAGKGIGAGGVCPMVYLHFCASFLSN